ncbi:protein phosphatase CheZ [Zavarzinia compransoris]|uniref:Chemotaxis protein CheZ n=1 Tax=Zavarzinia compransoris TaxID=1264899 RepID=A0A317DZF4_9PROT|nr:protein phosphatase CheZ [Zavarzinia compransoris]PWR19801.1 chemotaxis protein CheZ [Zavarzinia compransoris]TDP45094.1 chemotaxis protein CheZ [Zavarzinia compransoris]
MSNTTRTFNDRRFADRLAAIAAETGGRVPVAEIGRIVASLLDSLEGGPAAVPVPGPASASVLIPASVPAVADELESLLAYIHQTQAEIAALRPAELTGEKIPQANDQLRSVVDATEQATGVFLDIAEELEALADTFGSANADDIRTIATRIYEASNFQDITGQRINKVTETLRVIEERLSRLVEVGGRAPGAVPPPPAPAEAAPVPDGGDGHLLNGPQLPASAATQDDIDRLFASI